MADLAINILTVLPYLLYLTLTEWKTPHATWGKRTAGIAVVGREGGPPTGAAVVVRNLIEVMPWQLGHMGTPRLVASTVDPAAIWFEVASLVLVAVIVVPILVRRPGIHDLMAGTRVVPVEITGGNGTHVSPK